MVPLLAVLLTAIAVSGFLGTPRSGAFPQKLVSDSALPSSAGFGDMVVVDHALDGYSYLVLSNRILPSGTGSIEIYVRNTIGSGYIQRPSVTLSAPSHQRMIFEDVNNDTWPDLILLTYAPEQVLVYLQPVGGYAMRLNLSAAFSVPGAVDIAAGNLIPGDPVGSSIVVVYPTKVVYYPPLSPFSYRADSNVTLKNSSGYSDAIVSDIDGDGYPDLVLAGQSGITVYYGRIGGIWPNCTYPECRSYLVAGNPAGRATILAGDVTSDGRPDLVMAVSNAGTHTGTITVFAQDSTARNFTGTFFHNADFTGQITLADLNGDGRVDIAAILYSGGRIAFLYQRPNGSFDNRVDLQINGTSVTGSGADEVIASVEFNDDGYRDIALRAVSSTTPAVRSIVSFFFQENAPVDPTGIIPYECPSNCSHLTQNTIGFHLIDLSKYFRDDHGLLSYNVTYQEQPQNLTAILDGHYLTFVPKQDWYGVSDFRVSANDGGIGHVPTESNTFSVMVNAIPEIVNTPPAQVHLGDEYRYLPSIRDPFPATDTHTFALLQSPPGASIDLSSGLLRWTPTAVGNYTFSMKVTDAYGASSPNHIFSVEVLPAVSNPPDNNIILIPKDTNGLIVAGALLGTLILVAAMIVVNENVKYGTLLLLIPLYSKIKREKVLDHFIRGQIFGYVTANPGEHYNAIKQALDITNGSLAHHLKTLEREHFVKSKRFGLYRRFYPWAMRVPEDGYFQLNEIQKNILDLCRHQPGITQKDISSSLRLTPPTINYHIAILAEHGHVSVVRRGRKTHVYVLKGGNDEAGREISH